MSNCSPNATSMVYVASSSASRRASTESAMEPSSAEKEIVSPAAPIATGADKSSPSSNPPPGDEASAPEATNIVINAALSPWELLTIVACITMLALTLWHLSKLRPPAVPRPIAQCEAAAAGEVVTIHIVQTSGGGFAASCLVSKGRTR